MAVDSLPAHQRWAVEDHLARCAACRSELQTLQRLGTALSRLPNTLPTEEPGSALLLRWQKEIRLAEQKKGRQSMLETGSFLPVLRWGTVAAMWVAAGLFYFGAPETADPRPAGHPVPLATAVAVMKSDASGAPLMSGRPPHAQRGRTDHPRSGVQRKEWEV